MIRLERVYDPPEEREGFRVLVDRLWPRGVRKEDAGLDLWMKAVAPSHELRRWFHGGGDWNGFRGRYRAELSGREAEVALLRQKARDGVLTLVYAARDRERNHAVVLRDHLEEAPPGPPPGPSAPSTPSAPPGG